MVETSNNKPEFPLTPYNHKYFAVIDHHEFDLDKHNLRQYGRITRIHCIEFTVRDLSNPLTDPLGVYYEDGVRKYLWKDMCLMELNIPVPWFRKQLSVLAQIANDDVSVIGFNSILVFLSKYERSLSPTELDDISKIDAGSYMKTFARILYEINYTKVANCSGS